MRKEKYAIDRIENGLVVLIRYDDGSVLEIEDKYLKNNYKDGDIVYIFLDDEGSIINTEVDEKETITRKRDMRRKLKSLFDK